MDSKKHHKIWKIITLIFLFLLFLVSFMSCLYINNKITTGEKLLTTGQKQYANGQQLLNSGKAKLAAGKRKLSTAKSIHGFFKQIPIFGVTPAGLVGQKVVSDTGKHFIKEGEKKVAHGEKLVAAGEKKLNTGAAQLSQGAESLAHAKRIRMTCGIAALIFFSLMIALIFYWRKRLFK